MARPLVLDAGVRRQVADGKGVDLAVIAGGAGTATTEPAGALAKTPGGGTLKSNGTTWEIFGGGGVILSATVIEIDFGTTAAQTGTFTFADPFATTTSIIVASQSAEAPGGNFADEAEWTPLLVRAACYVAGTITFYVDSLNGSAAGKHRIAYTRS